MKLRRTRSVLIASASGLLVVLGGLWLAGEVLRPERDPSLPPTPQILSAAQQPLLQRACFDCHSNETRYPWYTRLPVLSLVIGGEVSEARKELNFTSWNALGAKSKRKVLQKSIKNMDKGEMPPTTYLWMHPKARLSAEEKIQLGQSLRSLLKNLPGQEQKQRRRDDHGERDKS